MSEESDGFSDITTGGGEPAASSAADNNIETPQVASAQDIQPEQAARENKAEIKAARSRLIRLTTAFLQARKNSHDTVAAYTAENNRKDPLMNSRNQEWGKTIVLVDAASPTQLEREIAAYLTHDCEYFTCGLRMSDLRRIGSEQYKVLTEASEALKAEICATAQISGIDQDSAYQAATWLIQNTSLNAYVLTAPEVLPPPPEGNGQKLAALERVCSEVLEPLSEALSFVSDLRTSEYQLVSRLNQPSVEEPRRPSPEETQRWLRQLEDFMIKRQRAHRQFAAKLEAKSAWETRLRELVQKIVDAMSSIEARHTKEANAVHSRGHYLRHRIDFINQKLAGIYSGRILDKAHRPTPEETEKPAMAKLQRLLNDLALALGYKNEAQAVLRRTKSLTTKEEMGWWGLDSNADWQDCLRWWKEKREEARKVAGDNLISRTRMSMAIRGSEHYESQVAEANAKVWRFLLQSDLSWSWCDQMRVLINVAAWTQMYGKDADPEPTRVGRYPIY